MEQHVVMREPIGIGRRGAKDWLEHAGGPGGAGLSSPAVPRLRPHSGLPWVERFVDSMIEGQESPHSRERRLPGGTMQQFGAMPRQMKRPCLGGTVDCEAGTGRLEASGPGGAGLSSPVDPRLKPLLPSTFGSKAIRLRDQAGWKARPPGGAGLSSPVVPRLEPLSHPPSARRQFDSAIGRAGKPAPPAAPHSSNRKRKNFPPAAAPA